MIDDLQLHKSNVDAVRDIMESICSDGKRYRVSMVEWRDKRSLSQNALVHMWFSEIAGQAVVNDERYSPAAWKVYLKKYFCPERVIALPGGGQERVKKTSLLDTAQMHHFMTQIEQWAQGHMFVLTIPDNSEYKKLQNQQEK